MDFRIIILCVRCNCKFFTFICGKLPVQMMIILKESLLNIGAYKILINIYLHVVRFFLLFK